MSAPTFSSLHATHRIEGDPSATADVIIAVLRLTPTVADILRPLIVERCDTIERNRVRAVEHRSVTRSGKPVEVGGGYRAMLTESFLLPGGVRVRWGEATVEQHQARVAMLQAQRNGLQATIDRHAAAIVQLLTAGADCLDELVKAAA